MIYPYRDGIEERYIDFDKVEEMTMRTALNIEKDKMLTLTIKYDSGKETKIKASIGFIDDGNGGTKLSEYPIEKLRKVANAWKRWKNDNVMEIEREIDKGQNGKEVIKEKITKGNGKKKKKEEKNDIG